MKKNIIVGSLIVAVVSQISAAAFPDVRSEIQDGDASLQGPIALAFENVVKNHVLRQDPVYLSECFKDRTEVDFWQTEFWGKYMHSAAPFWAITKCRQLKARIDAGFDNLVSAQLENGYIGNYREDRRSAPGTWDVWGIKYTMLGLLHYYDIEKSSSPERAKRAIDACRRLCDYLIVSVGPGSKNPIASTGNYAGMPSCSSLEPVMWLYNRTKERKYLDFAAFIVKQMTEEEKGPRLLDLAQKGVPVAERSVLPKRNSIWSGVRTNRGKAYEMMSCCQGLLDYYLETGDRKCLDAVVLSAENIIADEIDIAGGGTQYERFCASRKRQMRDYAVGSEMCVLTTWMRLCQKLSTVTGESKWADELERTFYNSYLGSFSPATGSFDAYASLAGERESAHPLHCRMQINCCEANGPRGFLAYLGNALTYSNGVVNVNQYLFGIVNIPSLSGKKGSLGFNSFTQFPRKMRYALTLDMDGPEKFTLRFRVPSWSGKTTFTLSTGEKKVQLLPGYVSFTREWKDADQIEVVFEDRVKEHVENGHVAFTYGPLALARDVRFCDGDLSERVRKGEVKFSPVTPPDSSMYAAFSAFLKMGVHDNPPRAISFCDFSSAGSTRDRRSFYRVWLPLAE